MAIAIHEQLTLSLLQGLHFVQTAHKVTKSVPIIPRPVLNSAGWK